MCSTSQPRHCHTQREISKVPKEKIQKTTDRQEPLAYTSLFMGLGHEELMFSIEVHFLETARLEWDPNTKCLQFLVLITSLCVFKAKQNQKQTSPFDNFFGIVLLLKEDVATSLQKPSFSPGEMEVPRQHKGPKADKPF